MKRRGKTALLIAGILVIVSLIVIRWENFSNEHNDLKEQAEKNLPQNDAEGEDVSEESSAEEIALAEETVQYYLSLQPDCRCTFPDGVEYRMIPVDRAAGSSCYVLIAAADSGTRIVMVNQDPYLGSGGSALWISFLQDGQTGFSCLTHSGGTYGKLYRTEDGGRSYEIIEYPSAEVALPDGTYYNPFVLSEKVYERNGKLYMEAGQGPDGDYCGEKGFCNGLYESEDNGKSWTYVGEIAVTPAH